MIIGKPFFYLSGLCKAVIVIFTHIDIVFHWFARDGLKKKTELSNIGKNNVFFLGGYNAMQVIQI